MMPPPVGTPSPGRWRGLPLFPGFRRGLSLRLLLLTVAFVMLSEVLIFAPSVGRFRLTYLQNVLADAHLALMAVEATPDGMVDMDLQRRLLANAGTLGMMAWRPERARLVLGPDMPPQTDADYDIRDPMFFSLILDAVTALVRTESRIISVLGPSPKDPAVVVEALVYEQPMITEMRAYAWRIVALSAFISSVTAGLVFVSLHLLLVKPLRRLSAAMLRFQEDPEDRTRILAASARPDELGVAERSLSALQCSLATALHQQKRLAAVGTGVAKIAHDLKGVLTTALLESDRLEASTADSDLQETTRGIARALERAITLATSTLRYAAEGPPVPVVQPLSLSALCREGLCRDDLSPLSGAPGWQVDTAAADAVRADPDMLLRVLENLGRNAAEAGATTLCLTARPDGASVAIRVRDDGRGLPPKAQAHLFTPFSGSARPGGTGLGLPIARDLLRAMGGDLHLVQTSPTGTTFGLTLPAGGVGTGGGADQSSWNTSALR